MAAPPIDPPSVPDEPPSKKQKLPKGIVPHRTEKFQARLSWKEDGKTNMDEAALDSWSLRDGGCCGRSTSGSAAKV